MYNPQNENQSKQTDVLFKNVSANITHFTQNESAYNEREKNEKCVQ